MKNAIPASVLSFLKELKKHNDREWFNKHKDRFLAEKEHVTEFAESLLSELKKTDNIETESGKKSLHRIYRDTHFSKDKIPYKINFSGSFTRATKKLRGGYYFHIEPGNSFAGGGFWAPNKEDLQRIREDIDSNYDEWNTIIQSKTFKNNFGELLGTGLKSAPRGYAKDHPAIDLLRKQQFLLMRSFTDQEVLNPDFLKELAKAFKNMRPFFDYMSEVLTTDANGEPLF